ncbi:MAG: phenylacetate--CoA ligase family protein, partial [Pseudomonadota bacterium]|nr:phenylacetate--CoA ligase family protein [Pseudomonadota bacterium]
LKCHGEIIKGRLTVDNADGRDSMVLICEVADGTGGEALAAALRETIQNVTKLRGEVRFTGPGTLPGDGKVIDDTRTFE